MVNFSFPSSNKKKRNKEHFTLLNPVGGFFIFIVIIVLVFGTQMIVKNFTRPQEYKIN